MTTFGVDYSSGRPSPAALRAAGYTFACRYLAAADPKRNPQKALTRTEADALRAGGVDLVSNWETTADRALDGRAAGVHDAQEAMVRHTACGGPPNRPIYFSVDFDAAESQQPAINAYFAGVASVIGLPRTGAYGGYWVIKRLFDAGLIRWGWQTYAWSGGHWDARAQLRQVQNGITVGGADCDRNEAMVDDFGQWGYRAQEDEMAFSAEEELMIVQAAERINKAFTPQDPYTVRKDRGDKTTVTEPNPLKHVVPTASVDLTDAQLQAVADKVAAQVGGKLDTILARLTAAGDALDG